MEAMVIFSVGLVAYCGYISLLDAARDREREQRHLRKAGSVGQEPPCPEPGRVTFSGRGRGDGAAAHWPRLAKGSA